ncbi:MAG: hypothetical protein ABI702_05480 [Burkholderiales bacterium]
MRSSRCTRWPATTRCARCWQRRASSRRWKTTRRHFAGSGRACSSIWCRSTRRCWASPTPGTQPGFAAAVARELAPQISLKHLTAPYFLATKFEAFNDRGGNDVYLSHDLEDILTVIDGRAEVVDELGAAPAPARSHVVAQVRTLLNHRELLNALPGLISLPARSGIVLVRLQQIAALTTR